MYSLINKGIDSISVEFTPEAVYEIKILQLESKIFFRLNAQNAVNKFVGTNARLLSFEPTDNELIFNLFYKEEFGKVKETDCFNQNKVHKW